MTNWCINTLVIRGQAADIEHFKNSLLKVNDRYQPFISTVPLPKMQKEEEIDAYFEREYEETLHSFGCAACDLVVTERSPEILEMRLATASSEVNLELGCLFPKLNILLRFYERMNNYSGFKHWVRGRVIAEGSEVGEDQDSPPELYDYRHPDDPDLFTKVIVVPMEQLGLMKELVEQLKKNKNMEKDSL